MLLQTSLVILHPKKGNPENTGGGTREHTRLQSRGKTARFGSLLLALEHPVVTRKSLSHSQEEAFSSKRAGKLLWDGNHLYQRDLE